MPGSLVPLAMFHTSFSLYQLKFFNRPSMLDPREGSALLECMSTNLTIRWPTLSLRLACCEPQFKSSKKQIIVWRVIIKCNQGEMGLIINAANCIHCKTCDIKVNRIYLSLSWQFNTWISKSRTQLKTLTGSALREVVALPMMECNLWTYLCFLWLAVTLINDHVYKSIFSQPGGKIQCRVSP